jgi:hypothetical protein
MPRALFPELKNYFGASTGFMNICMKAAGSSGVPLAGGCAAGDGAGATGTAWAGAGAELA